MNHYRYSPFRFCLDLIPTLFSRDKQHSKLELYFHETFNSVLCTYVHIVLHGLKQYKLKSYCRYSSATCFLSLNIMFLRFIHVDMFSSSSLILTAE